MKLSVKIRTEQPRVVGVLRDVTNCLGREHLKKSKSVNIGKVKVKSRQKLEEREVSN